MKRFFISYIFIFLVVIVGKSQIGYQVSLLDRETGAPRVGESVSVTINITNSEGATIISETKNATTNEFGVLSLKVGSENTFTDMDWTKLPLWISATVEGVVIGKSQILNVPVAEYAKNTGVLTPKTLCSHTWRRDGYTLSFNTSGTGTLTEGDTGETTHFSYEINGDMVLMDSGLYGGVLIYGPASKKLYGTIDGVEGGWK